MENTTPAMPAAQEEILDANQPTPQAQSGHPAASPEAASPPDDAPSPEFQADPVLEGGASPSGAEASPEPPAQPVSSPAFKGGSSKSDSSKAVSGIKKMDMSLLVDVPLQVTVELGRSHMTVREVLNLEPGSVVELDRTAGDVVDIFVNDRMVARGEVVVVDDNFGVRITEIVSGVKQES